MEFRFSRFRASGKEIGGAFSFSLLALLARQRPLFSRKREVNAARILWRSTVKPDEACCSGCWLQRHQPFSGKQNQVKGAAGWRFLLPASMPTMQMELIHSARSGKSSLSGNALVFRFFQEFRHSVVTPIFQGLIPPSPDRIAVRSCSSRKSFARYQEHQYHDLTRPVGAIALSSAVLKR